MSAWGKRRWKKWIASCVEAGLPFKNVCLVEPHCQPKKLSSSATASGMQPLTTRSGKDKPILNLDLVENGIRLDINNCIPVDVINKKPSFLKRPSTSKTGKTEPIGKVVLKRPASKHESDTQNSKLAKKTCKDSDTSKLNMKAVDNVHDRAPHTTWSALRDAETDDESRHFNLHDGAAEELGPEYRAVWMKAYVKKCTVARSRSKCWERQRAFESNPDGQEVCEILKFPCESYIYNVKKDHILWTNRCMENPECQAEPANGKRKVWLTLRANYVVPRNSIVHVPMNHGVRHFTLPTLSSSGTTDHALGQRQ